MAGQDGVSHDGHIEIWFVLCLNFTVSQPFSVTEYRKLEKGLRTLKIRSTDQTIAIGFKKSECPRLNIQSAAVQLVLCCLEQKSRLAMLF